ncbi:MAG: T9SS C-terminal target domain-containing protein [Bacteroidetes bacterium]|nr:T9SS C-terminal target domain-containing protein [Bacteroidota bacterium]
MTRFLQLVKLTFIFCLMSLSTTLIGQNSAMEHGATARWQWELKRLADPATGNIPLNMRQRELMFVSTLPKNTDVNPLAMGQSTGWIHRGPFFIGGRTRALGIDVANPKRILAGSVSGGMWLSENDGKSWHPTQATNEFRSATCIAQDIRPNHQQRWYMGTGEAYGQSAGARGAYYLGDGLFSSDDSGKSWQAIASTAGGNPLSFTTGWQLVWNLAVDPSAADTSNEIYAAIYNQIQRSSNGGKTWVSQLAGGYFTDVAVTSKGVVYATSSSDGAKKGIFRADNDGKLVNINPSFLGTTYKRIVIGVDPNNENVVYFLLNTDGFGRKSANYKGDIEWNGLYRYTYLNGDGSGDSGKWEDLSMNLPNGGAFDRWNVQGSYDMLIRVRPGNSNEVYIGGTNVYRSTTGFSDSTHTEKIGGYKMKAQFPDVGVWANHHPDQHNLLFYPNDGSKLLSSNDGGVFRSVNLSASPFAWESLNNGYLTTQFYTVALDHGTPESPLLVGGAQDNNQLMTVSMDPKATWSTVYFGDGSYCAMEDGAKLHYFSKQQGKMIKATVDAAGNRTSYARIDPIGGEKYLFINPFVLDPTDNNTMYLAGGKYLWRNNNLRGIPLAGNNDSISFGWTKGTDSIPIRNEFISAIGVSSTPAHRVYYGSTLKRLYRIDSADLSANLKPKDITALAFPSAYVSCVAVDPRNADRLMVSFSNYNVYSIFNSEDGGKTFNKAAGNLEQFATGLGDGPSVRWLSILPVSDGTVYLAATSAGFFATDTLMGVNTKWVQQASGEIGNMVCDMFDVRTSDGTIGLATHGNGIYSAKIVKKGDILGADYIKRNQNAQISVYPNPGSKMITVDVQLKFISQFVDLTVMDALGRIVLAPIKELDPQNGVDAKSFLKKQWTVDISALKSGVYYVRMRSEGVVKTAQIQVL